MVNIDTVYQKVLAFANKEQRGYVTPQEFNLYANQAQQEIFEQYFYDARHQGRIKSKEHVYPDMDDLLDEKLAVLEKTDYNADVSAYTFSPAPGALGGVELPSYIYRVNTIYTSELGTRTEVEILNTQEFQQCMTGGPLTSPNRSRPIASIRNNVLRVLSTGWRHPSGPTGLETSVTELNYYKKPGGINSAGTYPNVAWGYFVVGGKALYDTATNKTFHFELHPAEENELVYKILKYAGLSMKRDDIAKGGQGLESLQTQQEKL